MKVSSDQKNWKYARLFLDTSALFKLLAPELREPGTQDLGSYIEPGIQIQTCSYCIGEVLGILKRKWISQKESPKITTDGYLIIINRLNWKTDNKKLIICDFPIIKIL